MRKRFVLMVKSREFKLRRHQNTLLNSVKTFLPPNSEKCCSVPKKL